MQDADVRFQAFMDHAPAVAFIKDEEGRYVYVNRAFEQVARRKLAEVRDKTDLDVWPRHLAERLREHDRIVLSEDRGIEFFEVIPGLESQPREWMVLKFPIVSSDGRRFVGGMGIDITERRRAEQRLTLQYALTEVMVEATSVAAAIPRLLKCVTEGMGWFLSELWLVDPSVDQLVCEGSWYVSVPELEEFASTSKGTAFDRGQGLPGRVWATGDAVLISDVLADSCFARTASAARAGLRGCFALPIRHGNDVLGVLACFSRGVLYADADLPRLMDAVSRRIGAFIQRKRAEARVRELQKQAEERMRLGDIGAIAARIVHDVGNPLAGLKMQAQLILRRANREALPPSVAKSVEEIISTVKRIEHLVTGFTDFTRQQRLDLRVVRPRGFLQSVADFWRPVAAERDVDIACEVSEEVAPVRADAEKLRRVLDNLVKNALEAIDRGPGCVTLEASMNKLDGVRISVRDTGPGMPEFVQAFRLFETTKPNGSGIGLSIAQELILAHEGRISFERLAPNGTVFHVDLPSEKRERTED